MLSNLGKPPKVGKTAAKYEKRLFSGLISAFLKNPRCCNIFQGIILSQMEEETLKSRKGDTWGSEAAWGRGGAHGAQQPAALC